jgi:hypothetical protein
MATASEIAPLECPECHEVVDPVGKQTPAMALGNHRWKVHQVKGKYAGKAKRKRPAGAPSAAGATQRTEAEPTAATERMAVVHSITDAVGAGKGPPTSGQLTAAGGRLYGYLMLFRVSRLVEGDPRLTDDQRVEMIERLAPAENTCEAVASPLARALARSRLNRTAGRALVENIDVADCFVALLETERSLAAYRREVRAVIAGQAAGSVATLVSTPPAPGGPAVPMGAGATDYYAGGNGPRSPAPTQGVVVDAAMVAASAGADLGPLPADVNTGAAMPQEPVPPSMEVTQ